MEKHQTNLSKLSGFCILSVAFVWLFEASAVSPILSDLAAEFPGTPIMKLQMVSTMPFITSIIFSILAGVLSKRFDKKKIIIVGLLIYGITGIFPSFAGSINQILVLRFLTGIGVGLILPLPNVIITEHYQGEKRKRMLGLATSVSNLANVVNSVLIGFLLTLGWRYCFYAFLLVLVVMVINIIGLPKSPPQKVQISKEDRSNGSIKKIPAIVFVLALLMVLNWAVFQFNILNMAMFIVSQEIGSSWMIGLAIAVPGFGSMISGALFPELHKRFQKYLVFAGLFIYTIGFIILFNAHTYLILLLANVIVGFGSGVLVPYILFVTSNKVSPEQKDISFGIVTSCIHLGIFVSPFLQQIISIVSGSDSIRFLYLISSIVLAAATVFAFVSAVVKKSNKVSIDI